MLPVLVLACQILCDFYTCTTVSETFGVQCSMKPRARRAARLSVECPAAVPNFLMASDKPLVLLHGITMSGNAWQEVVPLLADHHEVFTPTALGHHGGPPVQRRPATITDVVDAAERYLDERRLERPHLAGNSIGGFMAIELARRGRASTVCAFSPVGFWSAGFQPRAFNKLQRGIALARLVRSILPFMYKSPTVRRLILRDVAWHGDRLSADRALEAIDEGIDCAILADLCAADWQIAPLDPCHARSPSHGGRKRHSFPSRHTARPSAFRKHRSKPCPASAMCQ